VRTAALLLCYAAAFVSGCGDDDEETTVVETTTVTVPAPPPPSEPEVTAPEPTAPEDPEAPANGHGGTEAPAKCGRVDFEPNTDSGAFAITAVETDCKIARRVAEGARNSTSDLSYVTEGFTCTGARSSEPGLSSIEWVCVGADREVVTFATS